MPSTSPLTCCSADWPDCGVVDDLLGSSRLEPMTRRRRRNRKAISGKRPQCRGRGPTHNCLTIQQSCNHTILQQRLTPGFCWAYAVSQLCRTMFLVRGRPTEAATTSKNYKNKPCAYCAATHQPTEREHVLAQEFMLEGTPVKVWPCAPACRACNAKKADLERYVTAAGAFAGRHVDALANLEKNGERRLAKNPQSPADCNCGAAPSGCRSAASWCGRVRWISTGTSSSGSAASSPGGSSGTTGKSS